MGMTLAGVVNMIDTNDQRYQGVRLAAGWIRDLESSDSRLHKERVIEKALMAAKLGSADAQIFLFNAYAAYNPFWTFNVKKVDETEGITQGQNPWPEFWALLEACRTRSISGNAMRQQIDQLSRKFDSDEWNQLARRVLIKDLRCGISDKTLNKVLGKTAWAIPVFGCQLAKDSDQNPNKMKGIKRLEVKLDGVRVLAVVTANNVTLYSRNGKVFENFPQIELDLFENRAAFPVRGSFVLDGEVVGDSFQKLMRQAHRKTDAQTQGMVYHVFDILPLSALEQGHYNTSQSLRLNLLEQVRSKIQQVPSVKIMNGLIVDLDTNQGHDQLRRFALESVAQGFEGIMIKDLGAPYECKRSSFWMKWKPTITVDLKIVDVEEGTGRNEGRLGAFICEGEDGGRHINVNVGSGFSDSDRDNFWHSQSQIVGHLVEVEADAITQNQDGSWSLRFPRFLRFRDFESGDKI
jgi:DNA ligase-1|nr:ATP-dependent DNA ligase [Oxalobacteraceae bacterium]